MKSHGTDRDDTEKRPRQAVAAAFFDKNADCVLDIGGQDMKCIKLKNGAVRIRSLLAAMRLRQERQIQAQPAPIKYERTQFTKRMRKDGYAILVPQMSPIHFDMLEPVFRAHGCFKSVRQQKPTRRLPE